MLQYEIIVYWSEQDHFYIAEVPELPGCVTDGQSYQEALANAETAIQEWVDTAKSLGKEVPEPKGAVSGEE